MFLNKIELKGFKSFADRTVIDFTEGITCIVGPNGSGKSNVTDAFRWVLGEQRFKTLRGSQMQDVIFNGTSKRKALGFAEAAITFDNSTGFLPVDYSEVTVTRRLYRSGESDYAINNNKCRLKDIKQLFMDTGVGVEGYSIIGQGRIDSILSTNKDERRLIFEEAAGIVKYRTRKEEASRKLDRTLLNLARIEDIVSELEVRVGPLKVQAEKAKAYLALSEELKSLEINLFINEIEAVETSLEDCLQEIKSLELKANDKKVHLESLLESKRDMDHELENQQEENQKRLEDQQDLQRQVIKTEGELTLLQERKHLIQESIAKLHQEEASFKERRQTLADHLSTVADRLASSQVLVAEKANIIHDLNQAVETLTLEKQGLKDQKQDLNLKVQSLQTSLQADELEVSKLTYNASSLKEQVAALALEVEHFDDAQAMAIERLSANQAALDHENAVLEDHKLKHGKIQNEIQETQQAMLTAEEAIYTLNDQVSKAQSTYDALSIQEANQEGFSYAVKQVLAWSKNDSQVIGCIKDVFKVEEKFETAIETALGRNLQNIVVKHQDDVDTYIERLKNERAGRATFMPVSSLEPRPVPDPVNKQGFYGCALHHMTYDTKVAPALEYILSNVYIADALSDAKKASGHLPKGSRIVTLDGEVVNVGGAITGGSLSKKETGFLKRKREIEELEGQIALAKANIEEAKGQRDQAKLTMATLRDDLNDRQALIDQAKDAVMKVSGQLDGIREAIFKATQAKDQVHEKREGLENQLQEVTGQKSELEAQSDQNKAYLKKALTLQVTLDQNTDKIENDHLAASQSLTESKIEFARLEEELKGVQVSHQEKKEALDALERANERRHYELETLANQEAILADNIERGNDLLKEKRRAIMESEEALQAHKSSVEAMRIKLQGMSLQIENLRNMVSSQNDHLFKLHIQQTKLETRKDNILQNLWDKYELSYVEALDHKHDFDQKAYASKARQLKSQIKDLGEVNVGAIEEYDTVSERYEFLSDQKKDLLESCNELKKLIKDMDKQMRASFKDKLDEINDYFKETFKNLFGGGFGEITTDDVEDILEAEIIINAQPPGKKLQSLELMSGGEKALTAIALLFAILKTKPSPFCILDEIEAALDDVNIFRFAEFLKEFVKNSQFIIITHRKGTMEIAKSLYGVTMQEQGVSTVLSVKLEDSEAFVS